MKVLKSNCKFCQYISELAVKAMIYEVSATPKPGLVDRNNSGAHNDMDFFTFMSSSASLTYTFYECALEGVNFDREDYRDLLKRIRPIGIKGEEKMFNATRGVNTHKGLIFSLGIIAAAAGNIYKETGRQVISSEEISMKIRKITKGITEELKEIDRKEKLTYGEKLYKKYGTKGIRGEVESGFATVLKTGLPILKRLTAKQDTHINDILVQTLLYLMIETEDSNVLGRHNLDMLNYVKKSAREAIRLGGMFSQSGKEYIYKMDKDFIEKNISPGGSADLLAVTFMIALLENPKIF
ncbi:MAG: triphosphoribosyl-dephospho-CoA synthase [Candidatus Petromonas sp.]|nr:triphosphoribosyl-dephospho-CoA synthase [Candidatus Petromonas sp.]